MIRKLTAIEPLLRLQLTLGEACLWDTRTQRLHFVDIDRCRLYTYDPSSGTCGYEIFDRKITAIAAVTQGNGLVVTTDVGFAFVPFSSLPFPPTSSRQDLFPIPCLGPVELDSGERRFNDGAVDCAGRFLAGTMGIQHGSAVGKLYALAEEAGGFKADKILDKITCTNGMGWTADGQIMYFTDSWLKEIVKFDYDMDTGVLRNRRIFSDLKEYGEPDGMCMDDEGGVWSARWGSGKVLRLNAKGHVDLEIDFPGAWNMTCCVFGGPNLEDLYVTTASSGYTGEVLPDRMYGGDIFVVKGIGYRGVERNRFSGKLP